MNASFQERRDVQTIQREVERAMRMTPVDRERYLDDLQAKRAENRALLAKIRVALAAAGRPPNVIPFTCPGSTNDGGGT